MEGEQDVKAAKTTVTPATLEEISSEAAILEQELEQQAIKQREQEQQDPATREKIEKQLAEAARFKDEGNKLFAQGDKQGAMRQWHFASLHSAGINSFGGIRKSTDKQIEDAKAITIAVFNNLASCYLSQNRWDKVLYATDKVLSLDAANIKAHYRRARAFVATDRVQEAAEHLDKAMESAPNDPGVRALAAEVVKGEEAKLQKQQKELKGFLVGKNWGQDTKTTSTSTTTPTAVTKDEEGDYKDGLAQASSKDPSAP